MKFFFVVCQSNWQSVNSSVPLPHLHRITELIDLLMKGGKNVKFMLLDNFTCIIYSWKEFINMLVSVIIITFALKALPHSYLCVGGSGSKYFSKLKKKKKKNTLELSFLLPHLWNIPAHHITFYSFNDSLQVKLIRQFDI